MADTPTHPTIVAYGVQLPAAADEARFDAVFGPDDDDPDDYPHDFPSDSVVFDTIAIPGGPAVKLLRISYECVTLQPGEVYEILSRPPETLERWDDMLARVSGELGYRWLKGPTWLVIPSGR